MSNNLSLTPKTVAIVEKTTIVRAQKAKTTIENSMPKIARSPGQKISIFPLFRYRYTHHNGIARQQTSFSTKRRIYQTQKQPIPPRLRTQSNPNQSLSHISEKYEVPSLKCIGFRGRLSSPPNPTNHYPTPARNTRCPLQSALGLRVSQYLLLTTFPERTIPILLENSTHAESNK